MDSKQIYNCNGQEENSAENNTMIQVYDHPHLQTRAN